MVRLTDKITLLSLFTPKPTHLVQDLFSVPVHGTGERAKVIHPVCTLGCLKSNQDDIAIDVRITWLVLKYYFRHSVLIKLYPLPIVS